MKKKSILKKVVVLALTASLSVGTAAVPVMAASESAVAAADTTQEQLDDLTNKILKTVVRKSYSKKKALKELFKYVEKKWGYARTEDFKYTKDWYKAQALETMQEKAGSCYGFAAAYGYLARKATGYTVRVVVGKTNGFSGKLQDHAWTEIKIGSTWYICDTNLDRFAANSSMKYYLKKRNSSSMKKTYNKYKAVKTATVK